MSYDASGTRHWLLADERGSVIAITDDAGNVEQVEKYDAFGAPDAANQGRFQYTGQMWLGEVGLYHYKARAYHPGLGRFMQTDPMDEAGGMNLYGYAHNDPANLVDPLGLQEQIPQQTIGGPAELSAAERWLGAKYKEIAAGVFRSADRLRQFRMTNADLLPTHGQIGSHVHFEALDDAGNVIENLHIPVDP